MEAGYLYQGVHRKKLGPNSYQAPADCLVFVGYDDTKDVRTAKHGSIRYIDKKYQQDAAGSDKVYSMYIPCLSAMQRGKNILRVYEAPIDAMSDSTIYLDTGGKDGLKLRDGKSAGVGFVNQLVLSGLGVGSNPETGDVKLPSSLERVLATNPQITEVELFLDCDKYGLEASKKIADELERRGYACGSWTDMGIYDNEGMDLNEYLTCGNHKSDPLIKDSGKIIDEKLGNSPESVAKKQYEVPDKETHATATVAATTVSTTPGAVAPAADANTDHPSKSGSGSEQTQKPSLIKKLFTRESNQGTANRHAHGSRDAR
jgi:hypothetical protein